MSGNVFFQLSRKTSKAIHKRYNDAYWKCKYCDFGYELLVDHECRVSRVGDGKILRSRKTLSPAFSAHQMAKAFRKRAAILAPTQTNLDFTQTD